MCYTYDNLSRVTTRTVKNLSDSSVVSTENFTYDAAGNITDAPDSCFQYDTNDRLVVFNGNTVSYDLDGNMLSNGEQNFAYDSANRLVSADGHTYVLGTISYYVRGSPFLLSKIKNYLTLTQTVRVVFYNTDTTGKGGYQWISRLS